MPPRLSSWIVLCAGVGVLPANAAVDFAKDVYPVLQRACLECHGHEVQKAGLRLDDKDHAFKGGEDGPVIVAAQPHASELLRRVTLPRTDKESMPRRGKPLTAKEVAALRTWISEGAVWPEGIEKQAHWSYVKPVKSPLPKVKNTDWPRNEIDHFVLARLEEEGLAPSPQADTATLVRRLYLALIGLPPPVAALAGPCALRGLARLSAG